ncbi:probable F420-dependent oxidoreductase, Rv2161c family [Actinacidiphila yanglinensis]|uniref:Probable F420-dependent oxidoreductase, Rv2161c family n=1 Tax=Actinacidiphila yanglinensis TaxID=310779 RepID=A0A1H6DQL6_9ACTN|nr:LLM class flavin-dependent oxidoreductase [Actinacidiphila yanglinensis]SEG87520.1 probable F420-dependent oxidoreductase, Rv2161c family [Actinacidiphila yanglinensis]
MSAPVGQHVGFGIFANYRGPDPDQLVEDARDAERLGFDLFALSDHLHGDRATWEPWTALGFLAAATTRITLATDVLGLPYRAPAVLAKMAETLDRLSRGRLVLGLGTGGYEAEFAAFGLSTRSPGQKVAALDEAVQVITSLWQRPTTTFVGRHFAVHDARIEPRPAHRIPVWLGTYGPRALTVTGRLADGWLPSLQRLGLAEASELRKTVRSAARAAGRDPDTLTCACNVQVVMDSRRGAGGPVVAGSSQAVAEQLAALVRAGFTFPLLFGLDDAETRERFATEVMPLVRAEFARA